MFKKLAILIFLLIVLKNSNAATCNGNSYEEKSQMCCNKKVIAKKDGLFCCQNTIIDAAQKSYFVNFTDLKCCDWIMVGKFDCCGSLQYNTEIYGCCNDVLYAKGKKNSYAVHTV